MVTAIVASGSDQRDFMNMSGKKTRVLIVGVGSIGERHVRCFLQTGRTVVGICETKGPLLESISDKYGISDAYSSLEDALQDNWDAAVVATPAQTHIPIACSLARQGVHLLIEKPLAVDLEGVNELLHLVEERQLVAGVAYVYRAHPGIAALREKVVSGFVGNPKHLVIKSGQCFPFYRPAYRETYYADRAYGGGAIQDAMTHLFNAAEWLVGPFTRICVDADHLVLEGVEVEDTVNMLARQGTVMTVISLNQFQPVNELGIEVHGDSGSVQLLMHEQCWKWSDNPGGHWESKEWKDVDRDSGFIQQASVFLDALEGHNRPLCTLSEGIQTLRVNLASLRSAFDSFDWVDVNKP